MMRVPSGRRSAPVRRVVRVLIVLFAVGATTGCTRIENWMATVPFLAFMHESPSFDPYEAPRPAPANAVPYRSPIGPYVPPVEPSETALRAVGDTAVNPLPATDEVLARGQAQYDIYCAVCHGATGAGDGPVIGVGKFPFAPDLTLPITVDRADGYLYSIIRVGRGLMPAYARIPHEDRWAIVHYIRQLQAEGGQQAGGQE